MSHLGFSFWKELNIISFGPSFVFKEFYSASRKVFFKSVSYFYPFSSHLTPCVCVDVLLTDEEQASVKGREDKAVVPRLPEELDVGGVGDARNGDAVAVLGGSTKGFGHLLFTHAPVRGQEGHATQE